MNKIFYPKLALDNLKKNKKAYIPYFISGVIIFAMYYIIRSIDIIVAASEIKGRVRMNDVLGYCLYLLPIVIFVVLFYLNSFVMKQRKKEIGLYCVLGMEKKHIGILMIWEILFSFIFVAGLGILCGAILNQAMFLLFLKIVHIPSELTLMIPMGAIGKTMVLAALIFAAMLVYDIISVWKVDPVKIIQQSREGEREPKAKIVMSIAGILCLGTGYFFAVTVDSPYKVLEIFLFTVLLVVAGTYLLFMTGSIASLKWMKKRESFYYKPGNFISISGLVYRMKKNAAGLATICILSTGVIVTLSSCLSLFMGEEDQLRARFPRQVYTSFIIDDQEDPGRIMEAGVKASAKKHKIEISDPLGYAQCSFVSTWTGEQFLLRNDERDRMEHMAVLYFVTQEDYNKIENEDLSLQQGEAAIFEDHGPAGYSEGMSLNVEDLTYKIKTVLPKPAFANRSDYTFMKNIWIVLPNLTQLLDIRNLYEERYLTEEGSSYSVPYEYFFDIKGAKADVEDFYLNLRSDLNESVPRIQTVDNRDAARMDFYSTYGSLMFVGLCLVTVFMLATVMIIYYKQITEGYEDRERFQILQKVGMSKKEVQKVIHKQILFVFFLPLAVSLVHMAMAFPALSKILILFKLLNTHVFLISALAVAAVFTVLYFVVYQITSRTYYRLVTEVNSK